MKFATRSLLPAILIILSFSDELKAQSIPEEFINPPREFSVMPFWFWNDTLNDDEIARQIADFETHGVFGFVIHPRIGLPENIKWLSAEMIHSMDLAIREASKRKMYVILYDEGMYPSGSSSGIVNESSGYSQLFKEAFVYTTPESLTGILDNTSQPGLLLGSPSKDIRYRHLIKGTDHYFIIFNEGRNEVTSSLIISENGNRQLLNPFTLESAGLSESEIVSFRPYELKIVRVYKRF